MGVNSAHSRFRLKCGIFTNLVLRLLGDKLLDNLLEGFKWLTAHQRSSVDHKAWSALHANLPGETGLLLDSLSVFTSIQAIIECLCVQSHLLGEFLEIVLAEGTLVLTVLAVE